jgi:hypothetical protein
MPVDMRKIILLPVIAVILIALAIGVYIYLQRSEEEPQSEVTDSYLTISGLADLQYFNGETVIVRATVTNNEPLTNESGSTATAAAGNNTRGNVRHTVIAELRGDQGFRSARSGDVSLARNERSASTFDFGPVPAGSYVVTIKVSGDDVSTKTAAAVEPTPRMNEWTSIGGVAFLLDNLGYDTIDVNIRNGGPHTVIFGDRQNLIFVNSSDDIGVVLQGLNDTLVLPGETVTVHAKIPCAGSYYLDYFAIAMTGRSNLVKFPRGVWMTPVAE